MEAKEKVEKVKLEAKKLEDKAKRLEELSRHERGNPLSYGVHHSDSPRQWIDDSMQVNDLLVESIKAKLQVLSNL